MKTCLLTLIFLPGWAWAAILYVPGDFPTVQSALDASSDGDTVLVAAGVYVESLLAPDHELTLSGTFLFSADSSDIDQCVIRPPLSSGGRCLTVPWGSGLPQFSVIGLTLSGGVSQVTGNTIGGIYVSGRPLQVRWCHLDSSFAPVGGALYADNSPIDMSDCRIRVAGANVNGLAFYTRDCTAVVNRTEIADTYSDPTQEYESVICVERGSLRLDGCRLRRLGWGEETVPGTQGIRQLGVVDPLVMVRCDLTENRIHTFFDLPGIQTSQPSFITFDSNYVARNEIWTDLFRTDLADTNTVAVFRWNVFEDNHRLSNGWVSRMFFTCGGYHCRVTIAHNLFVNNESWENSVADLMLTNADHTEFHHNVCINDSCAAFANPPGGVVMLIDTGPGVVHHNVFAQSHGYAAFQGIPEPPSDAALNFWGDSTGPLHHTENPFGQGDSVDTLVLVTPWETDSSFLASISPYYIQTGPMDFVLGFAYPNPFNSTVTIEYALTGTRNIRLDVVDLLGRRVALLCNERQAIGVHRVVWNAGSTPSGLYFARLLAKDSKQRPRIQKLFLLK